jgi:hypothetical protein
MQDAQSRPRPEDESDNGCGARPNDIYFGPIDMRAHTKVLSALRSDTPEAIRHLPLRASV